MREYLVQYRFSLKENTPQEIRELVTETSPEFTEITIVDMNPDGLEAAALWAARNNFEALHTSKLIWYVENLDVTSSKTID